jgi:hypothetical protein
MIVILEPLQAGLASFGDDVARVISLIAGTTAACSKGCSGQGRPLFRWTAC